MSASIMPMVLKYYLVLSGTREPGQKTPSSVPLPSQTSVLTKTTDPLRAPRVRAEEKRGGFEGEWGHSGLTGGVIGTLEGDLWAGSLAKSQSSKVIPGLGLLHHFHAR
jgi:hypothetical protein